MMPVAGVANCADRRQLTEADNPLNQYLTIGRCTPRATRRLLKLMATARESSRFRERRLQIPRIGEAGASACQPRARIKSWQAKSWEADPEGAPPRPPFPCSFGCGRDAGCPTPPAQIRASAPNAHGSYLGCFDAKRTSGYGCRISTSGMRLPRIS